MLFVHDASRYFLYQHAADMRKSFYSLAALVREQMQGDPLSGDIFIFVSRSRNQIKLLHLCKRLHNSNNLICVRMRFRKIKTDPSSTWPFICDETIADKLSNPLRMSAG